MNLMAHNTLVQPCLLEDLRASPFPEPGSAGARLITVISGRKCSGLYRKPDPHGSLLKMLLESSAWNSTACLLIWKVRVTRHSRSIFQLAPSMPLTKGKGSGLWPTPTVQDSRNNGGPAQHRRNTIPLNALAGGPLNPEWVEWLMGFPTGWTESED